MIAYKDLEVTIGPHIDGYYVHEDYVVGHVTQPVVETVVVEQSKLGYFILNTRTREFTEGMSKEEWLEMSVSYGIDAEPELKTFRARR